MSVGLLHALVEAIGESDAEIGGLFSTHLSAAVVAGDTIFQVEGTLGWLTSGRISLEGQVYNYTGITPTSLIGITYDANGVQVPGAARDHRLQSEVTDLTRARSALDLVRRALFVDYAEGDDLNTLGRNLNVLRSPFLADDSRFRKIVKALAYNPQGTMYGLELALDGLVDPGNYEIFEDLINYPCTIFIRLVGGATTDDVSAGKAFMPSGVFAPAASDTTVVIPSAPLHVQNVLWKDENVQTDTTTDKPSVPTIVEYVGQVPQPVWTFDGTNEAADVTVTAGQYCEILDSALMSYATYVRQARLQPESNADFEVLFALPSSSSFSAAASDVKQWLVAIHDTEAELLAGVVDNNPSSYFFGFSDGTSYIGTPVLLQKDTYYEVGIHKRGRQPVELTINGTVVDRVAYGLFVATFPTYHRFVFGCGSIGSGATTGASGRVKRAEAHATTLTDYWNSRGTAGAVDAGSPTNFDTNLLGHFAVDAGKRFEVRGSAVANAQGGNNNGVWLVETVIDMENATLVGELHGDDAVVQNTTPTRITVGLPEAFQFPQDLGQSLRLAGSVLGNDGTFVIDKLLDPVTFVDLQAALTQIPSKTNVCEVVGGAFVTESGLDWKLIPNFATEAGLAWELSDAGSVAGTLLTLRQSLPITTPGYDRVLNVVYTDVLSGQVLKDPMISNVLVSEGPPPTYTYYPFYVSDPLGFVRDYLDAITAAGVIPEFLIV